MNEKLKLELDRLGLIELSMYYIDEYNHSERVMNGYVDANMFEWEEFSGYKKRYVYIDAKIHVLIEAIFMNGKITFCRPETSEEIEDVREYIRSQQGSN